MALRDEFDAPSTDNDTMEEDVMDETTSDNYSSVSTEDKTSDMFDVSLDSVFEADEENEEEEPEETEVAPVAPKIKDHRVAVLSEKQSGQSISVSGDDDESPTRPVKKPPRRRWYIVHTYSGHENKVKINLERRIESMNMGEKIYRVEVPQKSVTKIKDGKRTEKEERVFPGYVLVEMIMDDDSWYVVRHTPGVTKFVGSQKKPIPAKDAEIKRILIKSAPAAAVTKIEIDLKAGDTVKIVSGPFADFEGTVTEVSPEKERLKASVSIFGRETPVELAFNQVQKSH